jgi:hypothetical protein
VEEIQPKNHYTKIQEQLQAGLVQIVYDRIGKEESEGEKHWNDFIISKDRIVSDQGIEIDRIHPDSLRALCHYAAILVSESTNIGIMYDSEDVRKTSDGRTIKGIFTVWGTTTNLVQEHAITRPSRPEVMRKNDLSALMNNGKTYGTKVPRSTSRLTGGDRF